MNYSAFKILAGPTEEPVSRDEVKEQLRILSGLTGDDNLIDRLIIAARSGVEKYLGRVLITQTLQMFYDYFPAEIELIYPPFRSVTHIKYYDEDGDLQTLSSSIYQTDLNSEPGRIIPAYGETWPTTRTGKLSAVEVQYIAGYGDSGEDVPQPIKQLIESISVDLYEHPEMNIELRITENSIYKFLALNYKIPGLG